MRVAYKIWLEKRGNPVFGMGIYRMLTLVRETGSLHQAAKRLEMSYRAAWGKIRSFEKTLDLEILERGQHGRTGAHLTEVGLNVLAYFERIQKEMDLLIAKGSVHELMAEMETYVKTQSRSKKLSTTIPQETLKNKDGVPSKTNS
jgi:molybdate transport system regulatory protein